MTFELLGVLSTLNIPRVTYSAAGLIAAIAVFSKLSQGPNLDAFPAVGSSTWLGSWWAGIKYLMNARNILQEGYEKYKSAPFKVAQPRGWIVIFSKHEHLEELARAPENVLSALEAINDEIQVEYTMGPQVHHNAYHVGVIQSHLTRKLDILCPELKDEITSSFVDLLDLRGNEWKGIPALSTVEKLTCRVTNRVFIGLPLCRDPDWIDLAIRINIDIIKAGVLLRMLPKYMRRLVSRFTSVRGCIMRGMKLLGPMIKERQKYLNEYGTEWDAKPNDILSWLMDEAEGPELTLESLTTRVLVVNLAANITSAHTFTQALFYLAANPQYVRPLREEVEGIVEKDGWSKAAIGKMRKVDSFLKECLRIEGTGIVSLTRKALQDFTFSDGTFIPKGTAIATPVRSLQHDKRFYENPDAFDPFRFSRMYEEDTNGLGKYQFASTSTEFLPFGHGRHACPGRFFVATELKLALAHVVMTYDVKLEDNAKFPANVHIGSLTIPNPRAKVMFRNRVD